MLQFFEKGDALHSSETGNKFIYYTNVTIGDTNLLKNMYFVNFFKIQGIVRELWVKDAVKDATESMNNGLILITKSASCNYYKDFYLYDNIRVEMQIKNIGKASGELVFYFYNSKSGELHAEGNQQIVFAGPGHKICRIPNNFLEAALKYSQF